MSAYWFAVEASDGEARRARASFARGVVELPAFMPVRTYGTVKAMSPDELDGLGVRIIVANTFHLMLRPSAEAVEALGGPHRFMHWSRPILTDSGGFQVFRLWFLSDYAALIRPTGCASRTPGAPTYRDRYRNGAPRAPRNSDAPPNAWPDHL